jgi:hypothetical protein
LSFKKILEDCDIMKQLNRWFLGGLTLVLALSLCAGPANAASKKKKKKEVVHHVRHEMMGQPMPIAGLNIAGKPGYFFADTASVLHQGQIAGGAHLLFNTSGSVLQIPVGASFGISDKLTVNANTEFYTVGSLSGLSFLNFGGKYGFTDVGHNQNLNIAAGLDFAVGPLSNGGGVFGFDPYGVVTYTFEDGFQLNGKLGLYIQTFNGGSYSFFQLDLGAAYPFDNDLTGIAELDTNGDIAGGTAGVGATPLLVGIRTGHDVQLQALAGLDLGVNVGLFVGGGIVLVSQ